MVQVNFNFAPAGVAVFREAIDQRLVVVFRGIKIGMAQRLPFVVPPRANCRGILATPFFQAPFLFAMLDMFL